VIRRQDRFCSLITGAARGALSIALCVTVSGCASLQESRHVEPVSVYVLEGSRTAPPAYADNGPDLLVSLPTAAAGYRGADMIYIQTPHRLDRFARHRWADTPASMLQPWLTYAAESSGHFRSVVSPASRARADLRLDTTVLHLYQDFRSSPSAIELAVRVSLADISQARLLATEVITLRETAAATPYDGVTAANRALVRLLEAIQRFLANNVPATFPRRS